MVIWSKSLTACIQVSLLVGWGLPPKTLLFQLSLYFLMIKVSYLHCNQRLFITTLCEYFQIERFLIKHCLFSISFLFQGCPVMAGEGEQTPLLRRRPAMRVPNAELSCSMIYWCVHCTLYRYAQVAWIFLSATPSSSLYFRFSTTICGPLLPPSKEQTLR